MIDLMPNQTFFLQMGIFLITLFLMNLLIFRPILRILVRRKELTEGARAEAEALNEKTGVLVTEYDQKIKGARDEGLSAKGQIMNEGESEARAVLKQAREDMDQSLENKRKEISAEAKEAQLALRKYSRDLSQDMAEKLLGRKVSA